MPNDPEVMALVTRLAQAQAYLTWIIDHNEECLADHPKRLARMREFMSLYYTALAAEKKDGECSG